MTVASQRAGWSRLPLRAAAFVVLTCATILGVSGWREWAARDAVLKGAETEMANVARSLTQHAEDSLDLLDSGVVGVVSRLEMDGAEPATIAKLRTLLEARKKAMERVHSLAIIDDQGNWLTSPGTISSTLSDDAFFRHHQLSPKREPYVGRPVKSLLDGEWVSLCRAASTSWTAALAVSCSRPSARNIFHTSMSNSRSAVTAPLR
ncbi:hypothetical protein ACVIJW_008012 [Bradyrhizobium barranii subsp. barranii]